MCSRCADKITTFYVKHKEASCPLFASYYCGLCAKHGHLQSTCPRQTAVLSKKLVPKHIDEPEPTPTEKLLEIKDDNSVIAAYLAAKGLPVSKKQAENRETLADYVEENDLKLVRSWQAKIIMPGACLPAANVPLVPMPIVAKTPTGQMTASVTSETKLADFVKSLQERGVEIPKKYAIQVGAKQVVSFSKLTSKDILQIVAK
jgi:hypothetical protein